MLKLFQKKKANKPKGNLLQLLLRPSYIKNAFDHMRLNNTFNRIIMAVGYPRAIREGWLNSIVSAEGNFDLSMFIRPAQIGAVMGSLNQELVKQKCDISSAEMKGMVNPSLQVQYEDTYRTLQRLQTGEEKLFDFSLYVNAKADTLSGLELLSRKVESELNSIMVIPKIPYLRMQDAMQSVLPLQNDKLNISRNIPSNALSACFPFTSSFLNLEESGVMFGLNKSNNIPIILDVYRMPNYNGLVLATSGAGKSFFCKLYVLRNLLRGMRTLIIDPQGEYVELCKANNGQLVEISKESETIINPFDLMGRDLGDKLLSLIDLFKIMCGELTEVQRSILDKSIQKVYQNRGIIANDKETWGKTPPTMGDLYTELKEEKKQAGRMERVTYDALINRIRIYAKGSFSFLNKQTNLDLEKELIVFNIMEMPSQVKPVMMFLILDYVHRKMQADKERKLLVIDEAWSLLRHGEHANYIFELIKTSRKFGMGIAIITQEVNDLLSSKAGKTILANTSWKLLLRQEPTVIYDVQDKFNLNHEEQNFILTAGMGEGLLLAMNDRIAINIKASDKEKEIITTNPDELREREKIAKGLTELERKEIGNPDSYKMDKAFYLKKELAPEQVDFLLQNGYIETRQPDFSKGRGNIYIMRKPPANESPEHHFLVLLIAEEIRKYTDSAMTLATGGADVVFTFERGGKVQKWGVEVETGKRLHNRKDLSEKTYLMNTGCDGWFFVVSHRALKKEYAKYHETLTRMEVPEKIRGVFGGK